MQNKANFRKSQMNVTSLITMEYENISDWTLGKNKPNQTQSNPIQSQFKANLSDAQNERKFNINKGL